jgi:two-component system, LuxR family, sensor kinase FixL
MESFSKNESHLKAVLESVVDGIITIDEKGKIGSFNPGAERIFGYLATEVIGQNVRSLMPEPDRTAHDGYMNNYLTTGKAKIIGIGREITGLRKDGTQFPADLAISEFWLGDERYFSGVVRDISTRKKAEKDLVDSQRRNQLILESAGEGIFGLDLNGNTMFANPAAEKMLGYKIEEMIGQTQHGLIHHTKVDGTPYSNEECHIYAAIKEGKTQLEVNEVFWRKDGTSFPVEYISTPIYEDDQITGAVVSFKDISERKKAEKERDKLLENLQISNKELEQFAYIASHDLKSPLRAIGSLTHWIKEDIGSTGSEETKKNLDLLIGRVNRMDSLINGVLAYSKIGKNTPVYNTINVNDFLNSLIDLVAPNYNESIQIQESLPTLHTEKLKLEQVFANLINNAIKHCDKKEPKVKISMEEKGKFLEFSVSDNGPGIDQKYHEKVFVMFQTLKSRDKEENTGIGLAIVKKLIDNKGGEVFIESQVSSGTTVKFLWPYEKPE